MNIERKPWLFLKRVKTWSPLGDVKELMPAPRAAPVLQRERRAWTLRARWSLTA